MRATLLLPLILLLGLAAGAISLGEAQSGQRLFVPLKVSDGPIQVRPAAMTDSFIATSVRPAVAAGRTGDSPTALSTDTLSGAFAAG